MVYEHVICKSVAGSQVDVRLYAVLHILLVCTICVVCMQTHITLEALVWAP